MPGGSAYWARLRDTAKMQMRPKNGPPPQHVHHFRSEGDCDCGKTYESALKGVEPFILEVG